MRSKPFNFQLTPYGQIAFNVTLKLNLFFLGEEKKNFDQLGTYHIKAGTGRQE
jgi:hypothetical protein